MDRFDITTWTRYYAASLWVEIMSVVQWIVFDTVIRRSRCFPISRTESWSNWYDLSYETRLQQLLAHRTNGQGGAWRTIFVRRGSRKPVCIIGIPLPWIMTVAYLTSRQLPCSRTVLEMRVHSMLHLCTWSKQAASRKSPDPWILYAIPLIICQFVVVPIYYCLIYFDRFPPPWNWWHFSATARNSFAPAFQRKSNGAAPACVLFTLPASTISILTDSNR